MRIRVCNHSTSASRISQTAGPTSAVGVPTYCFGQFSPRAASKCKQIGPRGGVFILSVPLDPSMPFVVPVTVENNENNDVSSCGRRKGRTIL